MLVSTIDEITRLFPNNTITDFRKIEAYMRSAERTFLYPILGAPLHQALDGLYNSTEEPDEHYAELLELVQIPVIQFGMHKAIPSLNITINQSGGFTVSTNENTAPASKDRTEKLLDSTLTDAWDAVDYLLEYLERSSQYFTETVGEGEEAQVVELWKESAYYWKQTGLLIFTAAEFEDAGIYIERKRRRFIELLPTLRQAQRFFIAPNIGEKTLNALIARKMDGQLSDADKGLLPFLQSALAFYTASQDKGLNAPEGTHGLNSLSYSQRASQNMLEAMRRMKGNTAYPDFPGNAPDATVTKAKGGDCDAFFLLSSHSFTEQKPV
ncbi:MAG: hypothetical protein LBQ65_09705 [Tannerellaceae bacterium]|jgi:hypothetical protein|nr:hypothetical protein [Tannerellaceae bacterium]